MIKLTKLSKSSFALEINRNENKENYAQYVKNKDRDCGRTKSAEVLRRRDLPRD